MSCPCLPSHPALLTCRGFASSALPQPAARTAPAPKAAAGKPAAKAPTVDVQRYVRDSITPFDGDDSFLAGPTQRTLELWDEVQVGAGRELGLGRLGAGGGWAAVELRRILA